MVIVSERFKHSLDQFRRRGFGGGAGLRRLQVFNGVDAAGEIGVRSEKQVLHFFFERLGLGTQNDLGVCAAFLIEIDKRIHA